MSTGSISSYAYTELPEETSFRVLELLPGSENDTVAVILHESDSKTPHEYEALSYTWGDVHSTASFICDGKRIEATTNLHAALSHLRYKDKSRFLWVDAICIDQRNIHERGLQVKQMRLIYENAKAVLLWLGRDSIQYYAKTSIDAIRKISDFLCAKLNLDVSSLQSVTPHFNHIITQNRKLLPLPNECEFSSDAVWTALAWFYSHKYFTRVWVIQEVNVSPKRILHCGNESIEWERVDLVASYIIMETAFQKTYGFTNTYCWWAASLTQIGRASNWLLMLYLASNFSCTDPRDIIYGLRGLMNLSKGAEKIFPDYHKSIMEVYGDVVEAALESSQNVDVLYYVGGTEDPSWIPRWEQPKLFRNPFRVPSGIPWKPAGETTPIWSVDRKRNILSLSGIHLGSIQYSNTYNERIFGALMLSSAKGREELIEFWSGILATIKSKFTAPFSSNVLTATAVSFSFGLDERKTLAEDNRLLFNFVAYLKLVFRDNMAIFSEFVPQDLAEDSNAGDGNAFGKPTWDFVYPDSSFFITENGLIGCTIATSQPGDKLFAALGSTYPHVLRPVDEGCVRIRGFAYVHGIMNGEKKDLAVETVQIV